MADEVGFVTMAGARATSAAPEVGIGMLGYAFMGKAHTNAYKKIPYMIYPPPAVPKLVAIAGRDEAAVKEAALRYGYEGYYTDWRKMLADPRVQLFDNGGPNNLHAEPCIAAAEAGKHILCEKPLARSREEAQTMLNAVKKTGVKHMVSFNYRFVPAIRQAYELIKSGDLGEIYHFRAVYLQEWIADPNFPLVWRLDKKVAGSGALGDLGAHIIDLGRFLAMLGERDESPKGRLFFASPDRLSDPQEGILGSADRKLALNEAKNLYGGVDRRAFACWLSREWQNSLLMVGISCWYLGDTESHAM